ncbi:cache domain-containing sensor histidine kinase [Paenibacillus sp. SYP-B4298]|uniref:cache domain-containing sensor histidine kinase n=1 Tax=Paenibacillus sp. SYP-B4298 TaxID=2996034 RepID=UPI0022DDA844|nr:sensor histidine kinase [Paenibacillus sp. SYP-B4298]
MRFARVRSQITVYNLFLLLFSMTASGMMYQRISNNFTEEKVGEVSLQTLNAMNSGVEALLESTNNYSKTLATNNFVQQILNSEFTDNDIGILTHKLEIALSEFMLSEPSISSVYLFDNAGRKYAIDTQSSKPIQLDSIEAAEWYADVTSLDGRGIWRKNGGGVFRLNAKEQEFISLIRVVNDINTLKKIGVLIVNITEKELKKSYERSFSENKPDLMIETEHETLLHFTRPELKGYLSSSVLGVPLSGSKIEKVNGHSYMLSSIASAELSWIFTSAQPLGEWKNPYRQFNLVLLIIMLFNFLFLFIGSVWISRLVTTPILHMLRSMKKVALGEFAPVHYEAATDELNQLKERYNSMIMTIEHAMLREKEEQQTIRRLELDILQQQIKPHFLYNTLESAGYLTLSGSSNEAYHLISELATFYRHSLSRGSEVIPLIKEIEIVESYLNIQSIRYPDIFIKEISIAKESENIPIPKLSLQPLVENALYHGIRPMGQCGVIRISSNRHKKSIELVIEDDGIGMTEDRLRQLDDDVFGHKESSFGLQGTLMRLKLYYGAEMSCRIISAPNEGTRIELVIPLQREDDNGTETD